MLLFLHENLFLQLIYNLTYCLLSYTNSVTIFICFFVCYPPSSYLLSFASLFVLPVVCMCSLSVLQKENINKSF